MRLLTLVAPTVLAAGLLTPLTWVAPADAAGETCRGVPATVVGAPGTQAKGTDGRDVIVSNGSYAVFGLAGDDLVCTTGTLPAGPPGYAVEVVGGPGTDVVDRSGDTDPAVDAGLWSAETVVGGPGADHVTLEDTGTYDIATIDGDDVVVGFGYGQGGSVDLGAGDDRLGTTYDNTAEPPQPTRMRGGQLAVRGGPGDDVLDLEIHEAGRWRLDLARGMLSSPAGPALLLGEFESHWLEGGRDTRIDVRGSTGSETVGLELVNRGTVTLGGGDDTLTICDFWTGQGTRRQSLEADTGGGDDTVILCPGHARVDAGRGHDTLSVRAVGKGVADLHRGIFQVKTDTSRILGFEDLTGWSRGTLRLVGDDGPNTLRWLGCRGGSILGLGGNDRLRYDAATGAGACETDPGVHAYGGPGTDRITGGPGRDRLFGGPGPGRDRADGAAGQDLCGSAEVRRSCERVV